MLFENQAKDNGMKNEEEDFERVKSDALMAEGSGGVVVAEASYLHFEGAIPPPEYLKGYGELNPSLPMEIVNMAKASNDAEIRRADAEVRKMDEESKLEHRRVTQGTVEIVLIFMLTLSLVGASVALVLLGHEMFAIATLVGGLIPVITAAIQNLRKK